MKAMKAMNKIVLIVGLFSLTVEGVVSQSEICNNSIINAASFTPAKPSDYQYGGLFVDIDNRVPCDSLVVGWYLCYFLPLGPQSGEIYYVQLSIFKFDRPINGILYIQRPETVVTAFVRSTSAALTSNNCGTVTLEVENQFTVYENEFIGVYVGENVQTGLSEGNILDVIGNTTNGAETVSWRCPRADNTIITAQDAFSSCLQKLPNHQIRAKLLISAQSQISPNTGLNGVHSNLPSLSPQPTTSSTYVVPRKPTHEDSSTIILRSSMQTSSGLYSNIVYTTLQPTNTVDPYIQTTITQRQQELIPPTNTPNPLGPFTAQQNALLVPLLVSGACVIVILIAAIVSVLIVICIHHKRKAKLELMKWRQERRNIMTDHFVLESELPAAMGEAMISNTPQAYEEPLTIHIIGGQFDNQTYNENIPRLSTNSYMLNAEEDIYSTPEELSTVVENEAIYSEAIYEDEGVYSEATTSEATSEIFYDSIESAFDCETPPPHIKALYAVVDKKNLRKPSITQPRESVLYQHYYKTLEEISSSSKPVTPEDHFKNPASSEKDLLTQFEGDSLTKIPSKEIKIVSHLGSGQFGQVSKGVWKNGSKDISGVAVKSFQTRSSGDKAANRVRLLQEAIIMGQFTNPNVIQFYGMVIAKDAMMLVMELATKGDLEHLLVSMVPDPGETMAPTTNKLMLGFCQQVAFGMQYLSAKGFVHRDLAARNVLVTKDNILKIADFGMSRDLADDDYYISHGGKIPVKWTAPEAIHYKKYSTASDVWAYGCLLYEIWSVGQAPYRDYSNIEAMRKVGTGYRLSPPPGCPRLIYDIMIRSWNPDPSQRTPFKELIFELLQSEVSILRVPESELNTHKLAGVIGGPLEAGENMYQYLQTKYLNK